MRHSKRTLVVYLDLSIDYEIVNLFLKLLIVTLVKDKAMKNFAIKLVWFTTVYVFVFAGLNQFDVPLRLIMGLHIIGVFLIPFMVYSVLTDNYTTTKTFKDWYENRPMDTLDEEQ